MTDVITLRGPFQQLVTITRADGVVSAEIDGVPAALPAARAWLNDKHTAMLDRFVAGEDLSTGECVDEAV